MSGELNADKTSLLKNIEILVLWICLIIIILTKTVTAEKTFDDIDRLISSKQYTKALQLILDKNQSLHKPDRLTSWDFDFHNEVLSVSYDQNNLYFLEKKIINKRKDRLNVVCLTLDSGVVRWSREVDAARGLKLIVNPQTNIVYLYGTQVISISTESGEIIERYDLPEEKNKLPRDRMRPYFEGYTNLDSLPVGSHVSVHDLSNRSTATINTKNLIFTTPDKQLRLEHNKPNWEIIRLEDNKKMFPLQGEFSKYCRPLWLGKNPVFVDGMDRRVVTCFDITTGFPKWSTVLGWGGYKVKGIRRINYQSKDYLLTIDGNRRLFIMKSEDGYPEATPKLSDDYLILPFQCKDHLIVVSPEWIRSFSLTDIIQPELSIAAQLQIRKALCLNGLREPEPALELINYILVRYPQLKQAWTAKAQICKTLNDPEETYCLLKALSLSGGTKDDTLKNKWGLLKIYNLQSQPARSLRKIDQTLFIGTKSGDLWGVTTGDFKLEFVGQKEFSIEDLGSSTRLSSLSGDFNQFKTPLPEAYDFSLKHGVQKNWMGNITIEQVPYKGRLFKPVKDGIEVTSSNKTEILKPRIDCLGVWQIHMSANGPIGYGTGVFELNKDFQPSKWIIKNPKIQGQNVKRFFVQHLESTMNSIGVVVLCSKGPVIQVYSYNGVLLNEAPIAYCPSNYGYESQFITLRDGYFLSNRQLVWVGDDKAKATWTFGPDPLKTKRRRCIQHFGNPISADGCLYVSDIEGFFYIFDSDYIVGRLQKDEWNN